MFDEFKSEALFIYPRATMTLYASGSTTGIVVFGFKNGEHYEANLYDMIPMKFLISYRKRHDPLIVGCIE